MSLTAEQKEMRKTGIGGSDMAAVCGLHPYKSAMDVYLEKVGVTEEPDLSDNEAVEWGNRLEEAIAEKYAQKHRVRLLTHDTVRHPKHQWLLATPDRLVFNGGTAAQKGYEGKTAGIRSAHRWGNDAEENTMPDEYRIQCHTYMEVFDLPWDLAVLIGGQEYREYALEPDKALQTRLIEMGEQFWTEHVEKHVPPAPDASEQTAKALVKLYPKDVGEYIPGGAEAEEWAVKLRDARNAIAQIDKDKTEAENNLKAIIGEAAGLILPDPLGRITWKQSKDTAKVDWKAVAGDLFRNFGVDEGKQHVYQRLHTTTKPGIRRFNVPRSWSK